MSNMAVDKIDNLEELISLHVGKGKKITKTEISKLTAPGDNYWSNMLKVDIFLNDQATGQQETLHTVAKCLLTNLPQEMKQMLPFTFKNELVFYTEMVPAIQKFLTENGARELDIFPELFVARSNIKGTGELVDDHALLVLENLKEAGFGNKDRTVGFDLEEAKLVLRDLALFHAVPLALKQKEPKVFQEKFIVNIKQFPFEPPSPKKDEPLSKDDQLPPGKTGPSRIPGEKQKPPGPPHLLWFDMLKGDNECDFYLELMKRRQNEREKEVKEKGLNPFDIPSREPFSTLSHQDMWVNNTMQKYENGRAVKNKFVDFQMYRYGSPANDLLFFLFSSVQIPVLDKHLDKLILYYHEHFIKTLDELKCDTALFSFEKFMKEISLVGYFELMHVMFMTIVIFGKKGQAAVDFTDGFQPPKKENITREATERTKYTIKTFGARGWIQRNEY